MARALWKGGISFGLVTIPVALHSAIESRDDLSFNLLHKKDGSRIVNKRFCKEEDVEVAWSEVVKGYEHAKGEYVTVTDEDFDKARVPATQTFEIRAFVPASEVEDLYFDHPYYVAPAGRAAVKSYALLRDALAETGKLAIGTIVLRQREHLAALAPAADALVLTTMRFAHEIRPPKDLDLPRAGQGWNAKEMKLARQLMDTLSSDWDPSEYRDTYSEVLRRTIEAKVEGKEVTVPRAEKRPRIANLAKALQASLRSPRRELARADGRRKVVPLKGARRRRRAA